MFSGNENEKEKEIGIATPLQSPKTEKKLSPSNSLPQEPLLLDIEGKTKANILPPFPLHSLPKLIASFIKQTAECNAGTTDGVGLSVLVSLGTVIGNRAEILIDEGWIESALLWGCLVADPGSNKTGILSAGTEPLNKLQKRNFEISKALYEEYEDRLEEYNAKLKKNKESTEELIKPVEPKFNQIFVNDTTMEALAVVLEHNPSGVMALFDELIGFIESMDMYRGGNGGDLAKWLSIFMRKGITINRSGWKQPKFIDNPFVSILGNLTPDNLHRIITKVHNGFPDRFLFVFPEKVLPYYNPNVVEPKLIEGYERVIDSLADLHKDFKSPLQVNFSEDAKALWIVFHDYLVNMTLKPNFSKRLEGVFSKFRGIFARIVLILHLTKYVCHETENKELVEKITVEQAFALVHYFIKQAERVYDIVDQNDMDIKIKMVQDFIHKRGEDYIDNEFPSLRGKIITVNDMNKNRVFSPKYDSKKNVINEVITELQEQGLGQLIEFQSKGTKPIRRFLLFYHPINV